jgi:acyl-coenzyme A thioesterase PaaI-like protein
VYAGALFTLAEIPGGALFLSSFDTSRFYPIVKALDLQFLKPATADVSVEVALDEARIATLAAEADERGKAEFVLEGQLKMDDGTVVATSRGVYQLRSLQRR